MSPSADCSIEALGDQSLLVQFAERIDPAINAQVHNAARAIAAANLPGISDIVPAYASLALNYDPLIWGLGNRDGFAHCADAVRAALAADRGACANDGAREITVPVCYGGDFGPDLDEAAASLGLTAQSLIERHAQASYQVAMLGFAPGFAYLLGLHESLHLPRRAQPRTRVPAGSVAIGGAQTGIYPRDLPGGWHLIGRTPWSMFDSNRTPPQRLQAGNRVRFQIVDTADFDALCKQPAPWT